MKAPTKLPDTAREMYAYLSYSEKYEGEGDDDFTSRKNLLADFHRQLMDAGLTLNELWVISATNTAQDIIRKGL